MVYLKSFLFITLGLILGLPALFVGVFFLPIIIPSVVVFGLLSITPFFLIFAGIDHIHKVNLFRHGEKAYFYGSDFQKRVIYKSNLSHAILSQANFSDAVFEKVNLNNVNAIGTNLTRSMIDHCLLCQANLQNADLSFVHFQHSDLSGANLQGAILKKVVTDKETNWEGAIFDKHTILPFSTVEAFHRGMKRAV